MKEKVCFVVIILLIVMNGCTNKDPGTIMNDMFYIVDEYQILLLCESDMAAYNEYIELLPKLKGNGGDLKAVVESLNELGDRTEIKNAIGVAYIRLREFDKARNILETAFGEIQTEEQQACISTNLAAINSLTGFHEEACELLDLAKRKEEDSPIRQLVFESNLCRAKLKKSNHMIRDIAEVKKLIKKEQQLLGSNQFIGIYNYTTLSLACSTDGQYKKSKEYMKMAIKLNDELYKYKFVAAEQYSLLAELNMNDKGDDKETFECINTAIEILEDWQEKEHPDLINMYLTRGGLYYTIDQNQEAIKDFEIALNRCEKMHDLEAISHYNIGWINYEESGDVLAAKSLMRAYYIWNELGIAKEDRAMAKDTLEKIYHRTKENSVMSFEKWFEDLLKEVKKEYLYD